MINPTMLYKHPGTHEMHGSKFDYIIVSESEVEAKLKEGWHKTTDEAKGVAFELKSDKKSAKKTDA